MPELTEQQIVEHIVAQAMDRVAAVDLATEPTPDPGPAPPPVTAPQMPGPPRGDRMTVAVMKEKYQRKCPKCGKFTELLFLANDERLPGVYCTKECGWCAPLPGEVETYYDESCALGPSIVELVKMAPNNCQVRALVLNCMGVRIPNSCKTSDDIFRWSRTLRFSENKEGGLDLPHKPRLGSAIEIPVSYSFDEYGSASYRVNRSGIANYTISEEDLRSMIEDVIGAGASFEELLRRAKQHLYDSCMEDPPEAEPGRYEYSENSREGEEDADFDLSADMLRRRVIEWMRTHASAALAELTQ